MPFTFRSFDRSGDNRLTVRVTHDLLQSQEHLRPVLETIAVASRASDNWKLSLSVDGSLSVEIDVARSNQVSMAVLRRGGREAILVVINADGDVRELVESLQRSQTSIDVSNLIDWITGCQPPLAGLQYRGDETDIGMDSVAMCVAVCFFARDPTN